MTPISEINYHMRFAHHYDTRLLWYYTAEHREEIHAELHAKAPCHGPAHTI